MTILYQARASAIGGRTGRTATDDGAFDVTLAMPPELGGAGGEGANPEQLFACGYAACFLGAIRLVAKRRKVTLAPDARVHATVGIGMRNDGSGFGLDVALAVDLPGLAPTLAAELVEEADDVCPYSHLARGNADVRLALAA